MLRLAVLLFVAIPALASDYPPIKAKVTPIEVTPRVYYVQGQAGVASTANEAFNSNAGFVVTGEGCVAMVLRRQSDAIARNDHIMASILGTALTQRS